MNEPQTDRRRVPVELICPSCGNADPASILVGLDAGAGMECGQCGHRYDVGPPPRIRARCICALCDRRIGWTWAPDARTRYTICIACRGRLRRMAPLHPGLAAAIYGLLDMLAATAGDVATC